jgi:hypothetical protein
MNRNLCKKVITNGGELIPLIIESTKTNGMGLMNPSIFNDNGKLILNLRHVNYTLCHCENEQLFNNRYGPLVYLNPENDITLTTTNYLCELDSDLSIKNSYKVDTSKLDVKPLWEFIGLEDVRLFRWDGKLYQCGVRRDTTTNGIGRMELSEIVYDNNTIKEISRERIPTVNNIESYCEKNWMPIIDIPYHFVKWTNPVEVVRYDIINKITETIYIGKEVNPTIPDFRGGSQVINYGEYRIALVHEVDLLNNRLGQKDANYRHRFLVFNKEWDIVRYSDPFSFMDGNIEFSCGMTIYNDDLLISFGFQDNAAYLLKVPENLIHDIIFN